MIKKAIGFIGTGKMGSGLLRGVVKAGVASPQKVMASDRAAEKALKLREELGIQHGPTNAEVASFSDVIVLAVKPAIVKDVLAELKGKLSSRHLVVSIAAGIATSFIESRAGEGVRVVRAMPNLACLAGAGAAAYCAGRRATAQDMRLAGEILGAVGLAVQVDEGLMDAVTGLSGSGPAYVAELIGALAEEGTALGIPEKSSLLLATQTVLGTARLLMEGAHSPADLVKDVATPGGTTDRGLQELAKGKFRETLRNAVRAATRRAAELGAGS